MWKNATVTILVVSAAIIFFVMLLMVVASVVNINFKESTPMTTQIIVKPSKTIFSPGEKFTVDVSIYPDAAVNVAGVQFNLSFNKDAVFVSNVTEGNFLNQGGAQTYFLSGTIDNGTGQLTNVAGAVLGAGQSVNSPGVFATIHCTAVTAGKGSAFTLSNVVIGNKDAVALPFDPPTITQIQVASSVDLNLDGIVNMADVLILVAAFGTSGTPPGKREDINADGVVNVLDLIILGQNFT